MLANILKLTVISGLAGGYYYLTQHRISLACPHLAALFQFLHAHRPQYTQPLFKALLKLNVLERDPQLQSYTLGGGFDPEGDYIEEVETLGFAGIEVGPTSFNPSLEEEEEQHLGIMNALANICTYRSRRGEGGKFRVDLCIAPNFEIIKYTPYLLRENLMAALDNFLKVQKHYPHSLVDRITITFQRASFSLDNASEEVQRMVSETKSEGTEKVRTFNESNKAKVAIDFKRRECLEWARLLDYIIHKQSL